MINGPAIGDPPWKSPGIPLKLAASLCSPRAARKQASLGRNEKVRRGQSWEITKVSDIGDINVVYITRYEYIDMIYPISNYNISIYIYIIYTYIGYYS
jgi:hypothetical protein